MLKKTLGITLAVMVTVAICYFNLASGVITSPRTKLFIASAMDKVSWYVSIPFIADLHCSALVWNLNFLERQEAKFEF